MIIFRRKRVTCETHTVHGKAPQIHRWLSDLLIARASFWKAISAPGVTGEWGSALGEAREKVATGRRAPGEETVFFRLRNSSLLLLSRLFADSLFFFFFAGTGAGCVLAPIVSREKQKESPRVSLNEKAIPLLPSILVSSKHLE